MIATLLAASWVGLIASAAWRHRPSRSRAVVPRAPLAGHTSRARPTVALLAPVHEHRARRRSRQAVLEGVPDVVDLFVVAVGAGLTVPLALRAVAPRSPEPFRSVLSDVVRAVDAGTRLADALESLPAALGEPVRPLAAALIGSARYGTPVGPALQRLSDEVRRDRQRRAEERARRVPVRLLLPLILCSLPALALLTIAPLLAGALRSLRL